MSRVNFIFPREDLLLPKKNGKPAGFPFFFIVIRTTSAAGTRADEIRTVRGN